MMPYLKDKRHGFPYLIDGNGQTNEAVDYKLYVRQLIEQVLFTAQGERVNRPEFGTGLNLLIFEPNSIEVTSTTQMLIQSSLQQWLGNVITVQSVVVRNESSSLHISVRYVLNETQENVAADFVRE